MDAGRGEVALVEDLVELRRPLDRVHEDDDLVELERVQQVHQLSVLLLLLELDVVLLQPVEGELGAIVDVDLERLKNGC